GRRVINGRSAPLDSPKPKTGKRVDSRADKILKPIWRACAQRFTIDPWRDSRHRRDNFNRIRVELQELAEDNVGLEADGVSIGANEGAAKNTRWPVRDVISLQRFQQRQLDLRLFRDGC